MPVVDTDDFKKSLFQAIGSRAKAEYLATLFFLPGLSYDIRSCEDFWSQPGLFT